MRIDSILCTHQCLIILHPPSALSIPVSTPSFLPIAPLITLQPLPPPSPSQCLLHVQPTHIDINIMQAQGATTEAQSIHFGKFNIFLLIKSAQNAYGLKSGDYGRYRRYCGHKVIKLRHSLGIKHGSKTKFVKRDYLKERPTESKTLQVLLFNAEKNWAAANETKFSQQRKASQKSRARFVSVKKLRRALCWARQLRVICGERTDQLTQLEAQAYELWLEGTAALEEGKWAVAQGKLIACREIMSDVGKASDSLSEKVFREKIDQVEQTIKFCNFKISKGRQLSITEIVELRKGGDPALSALIESLTEQRLREVSLDHAGELFFGEERYPIRSEAIVQQKAAIERSQGNLDVIREKWLASAEDDQLYEELLSLFSGLVLQTEQAIRMCDAEREDPKKRQKYTQGQLQILKKVSLLFAEMKMRVFIDRNLVIFRHSTVGNRGRKSSPQTIAKLLTATTSLFQELAEIVKQKGQISNSFEIEQIQAIDAKTFYLRTLRLLYVGQVYFNNGKLRQAHGLWGECQRCVRILTSKAEMNESRDDEKFIAALMSLPRILQQVRTAQCRSLIANFQSEETKKEDLGKRLNEIDIADQGDSHTHALAAATLEKLVEDPEAKLTLEQISQIPIIELPGKPQPIPTRPIFFDIYYNGLVYPDVQKKAKPAQQEPKKSWWGRIFK